MDNKRKISNSKDILMDRLLDFRSLPYVVLVAITAIVGIAADSGAEICVGNVCINAEKSRDMLTRNKSAFNSGIPVDSNLTE